MVTLLSFGLHRPVGHRGSPCYCRYKHNLAIKILLVALENKIELTYNLHVNANMVGTSALRYHPHKHWDPLKQLHLDCLQLTKQQDFFVPSIFSAACGLRENWS